MAHALNISEVHFDGTGSGIAWALAGANMRAAATAVLTSFFIRPSKSKRATHIVPRGFHRVDHESISDQLNPLAWLGDIAQSGILPVAATHLSTSC